MESSLWGCDELLMMLMMMIHNNDYVHKWLFVLLNNRDHYQ